MSTVNAAGNDAELIRSDIRAYLDRYENKELLRFVAVGSVDDGKSTLIGRLLHDTGMVYEDHLIAAKAASNIDGEDIDFSLLTDGLRAEREQGITIDVAYRYFSTDARKFIIADTPGHVQYTRNMVTGASTANVGVILIDARLGVLQQSRRHATIASMLGIPHLAVCVNKMDLTDYDQAGFDAICTEFAEFAKDLNFKDVTFFPISALKGTNVVENSPKTPWYTGKSVLKYLETVPVSSDLNREDFRFPIQSVLRPNLDYRGFMGQIASGVLVEGDEVVSLPSGRRSIVKSIDVAGKSIGFASSPQSVCIRLEDEIDSSRGDMLVKPDNLPTANRTINAHLVWMSEDQLDTQKTYLLKHTTNTVRTQIDEVSWKLDLDTLEHVDATEFGLNDIGHATLTCTSALFTDPYTRNRTTGAFVLIDSLTNDTVAAGMVTDSAAQDLDALLRETRAGSALRPKTQVSPRERHDRLGQRGATIWLTGTPGSGRWALAYALERRLFDMGRTATVVEPVGESLDGIISACKAGTDAGLFVICASRAYKKADRDRIRERIGSERFMEVYVNTDTELAQERRPEEDFSEFEPPTSPALQTPMDQLRLTDAVKRIVKYLETTRQFERPKR